MQMAQLIDWFSYDEVSLRKDCPRRVLTINYTICIYLGARVSLFFFTACIEYLGATQ